jgi:hypothetical protein
MCKIQLSVKYIVYLLFICCEYMQVYAECTVHTAAVVFHCLFIVLIVQNTNQRRWNEIIFQNQTFGLEN